MIKPDFEKYLVNLGKSGWKLGLERMLAMAAECANPQTQFPTIHIAGTNGKGTVARMLMSIYSSAGFKVGLYTSPHLVALNERMQIGFDAISDSDFELIFGELRPIIDYHKATFFEALTLVAFVYFARKNVDLAIIEVGLGGRFDATNIIAPVCTCVTSISFDHTDYLGDTLEKIAFEKGGIIKANTPCVLGEMEAEAFNVLHELCDQKSAPVVQANARFNILFLQWKESGSWLKINDIHNQNTFELHCSLLGSRQAQNILVSLAIIDQLHARFPVSQDALLSGFANVIARGRFHYWQKKPPVILDVAHNTASASQLRETLQHIYPDRPIIFVIGLLADKDVYQFIDVLIRKNDVVACIEPSSERALPVVSLQAICLNKHIKSIAFPGIKEAFGFAIKQQINDEVVVVTGSHFVVGEFLKHYE